MDNHQVVSADGVRSQWRTGVEHLSYWINRKEPLFPIANILDTHNPHYSPPAEFKSLADITPAEISALEAANDNQRYLLDEPLPEETRSQFESRDAIQRRMHDVYRAQVAYVDSLISNWLDETASELSESLIVVGDHGQMFGAEGIVGHHTPLHPHGIAVPAFVSFLQSWSSPVDITTPVSMGGWWRLSAAH